MPIAINGSGTVTGISVGGLPDGIVDTDMLAAKAATAPKLGNGSILQVKQALVNSAVSASAGGTTTFTNIAGMEVVITPTSSSNKILLYYTVNYGNSNSDRNDLLRIIRDASVISGIIGTGGSVANGNALARLSTNQQIICHSNMVIDSPATTSAVTYNLQWSGESSGTRYMNRRGGSSEYITTSHLTAMEFAA